MGQKSASEAGKIPTNPPETAPAATGGTLAAERNAAPSGRHHGHHPHIEFKFLEELKHRNVVRVALLYLVVCWLILEPIHVVFHMLEVPVWANRLVLILMAIGLPAVAVFAWAFEITPEGLKPTVEVDPKKSIRSLTGRRLDRAIIVVLALALGYFVADKFWPTGRETVPGSVTATPTPAPSTSPTIVAPEKSIAVLPFVDMSEKHDQEYFSDGLTEELIERLSRNPDLKVIARTSSFYFKGKQATIGEIANTLHVGHVLEGSVRKAGAELRVTAQLIRASDGTHLWSQTYDRSLSDIFKVQDDIAGTVSRALKVALSSAGDGEQGKDTNAEAHNLLLQGDFFSRRRTRSDLDTAIRFFTQASALDPGYALAWARLGRAYLNLTLHRWIPAVEGSARAKDFLTRALRIEPRLMSARVTLFLIHSQIDWDAAAARADIDRMREIDPNDEFSTRYCVAVQKWSVTGNTDELIELHRRQLDQDPLATTAMYNLANRLFEAGRFEESVATLHRLLQLSPGYAGAQADMGIALLFLERNDQALAAIEQETDERQRSWALPIVYWALGRRADSDDALGVLEKSFARSDPLSLAEAHAYRGETDAAFRWLGRAYLQHDFDLVHIKSNPLLSNLHKDPRYQEFLPKLKLAD
jgi:adenylate cyclase